MSIYSFLFQALKKANVFYALIVTIAIMLAMSYSIYKASLLLQSDLDLYGAVVSLIAYTVVERFFKTLDDLVLKKFIMKPFKIASVELLMEYIIDRSPQSLLLNREKMNGIKNAALEAVEHLMENSITFFTPILLLISKSVALSTSLDFMHFIIMLASLSSIFFAGFIITAYDHKKKKGLSKIRTQTNEEVRSLMLSLGTFIINGVRKILTPWILSIIKKEIEPTTRHDCIMTIWYGILEIATTGLPIALVWLLKGKGAFLPLYIIIQPMFWHSWWLFWTVKSLVVSTAPWSQYEDFMLDSKPVSSNLEEPSSAQAMMSIFDNFQEIKLIGQSGCGKSTLMKKIITGLCDKFVIGCILYIEQEASIPSDLTIYEYFRIPFEEERHIPKNLKEELLERAIQLGISNIVNENTLSKPFENPSGGECKRIIFMQGVLPILMNSSKVKIAFLDEVSAGLDPSSFAEVRNIIEEIKAKDVKVVSIDHHDFVGDNIKEVVVFKKEVSIPPKSKPKVLSLWQKMKVRFFPYIYHEKENERDLELGEASTTIEVWAPALGIEEP
jgi:ABC-type transporter Mla maintaining outer membrane lipid asymmetry ATPase subunit MlaF